MQQLFERASQAAQTLGQQAIEIWLDGGWAMIAIALIAFAMFGVGTHIYLRLRRRSRVAVTEDTWRRWIDHPHERRGDLGEILDSVTGGATLEDTAQRFAALRATEAAPFERDLKVMGVCVNAAPLVGLLGTVTGMLSTFGALAAGSGGDKTMNMVARGISEALITTETGLVIALPGLFFQYQLNRRFQRYKAFLAHVETVSTQTLHRGNSAARLERARAIASQRVAEILRARLAVKGPTNSSSMPRTSQRAVAPAHAD